ncbi:hypothetical protein LCGC14_2552370 [marine sediment metagenome]|uniref:Uncharacterized protein n=1 Tax=marine sediment metagenome TaxID=412755 RepID=A0A0F9DFK0_9ZZZZ
MTLITGPKLDEVAEVVRQWYLTTRGKLIAALEEGYPYGSAPLTPREQVERFLAMSPEDWNRLATKLVDRYRGQPNAETLARKDLEDYVAKMNREAFSRRAV